MRGRFDPMDAPIKVKATIHWVAAHAAKSVEVRLYDRLFNVPEPDGDKTVDFKTHLNPASLKTVTALVEPSLLAARPGRVRELVPIELPYPRRIAMREAPEFTRTVARLRSILETC